MRLSNVIRGQLRISWCNICNIISFVDVLFLATFESRHNTKAKLGIIVFQMIEYINNINTFCIRDKPYFILFHPIWNLLPVDYTIDLLSFGGLVMKEIANYVSKLIMNKIRIEFLRENEKTSFDTLRSIKMPFNVVLCNKRNNLLKIMIITQNISILVFFTSLMHFPCDKQAYLISLMPCKG